jgi:hypothetical protein
MTVVMAITTAGILQVFRAANDTEARSVTQSRIQVAMLRLDKQIRYAKMITTAALIGSVWYVEYLTHEVNPTTAVSTWTCHALRLRGTDLELLTWNKDLIPDPSRFAVLIAGVTALDASDGPFPAPNPVTGTANDFQRLRLSLQATAGGAAARTKGSFDLTFTALNSSSIDKEGDPVDTLSATVCQGERP